MPALSAYVNLRKTPRRLPWRRQTAWRRWDRAALEEAQLILTPLEAVDGRGCRLGKGGGYYDRALRTRKGVALGVALCYQVVERVPTTDWDEPLDGWVTAREIHILTKAR